MEEKKNKNQSMWNPIAAKIEAEISPQMNHAQCLERTCL